MRAVITYNGHPVQIMRVWPTRNVIGEPLLRVRSLKTDREWEVWGYELTGDESVINRNVEQIERRRLDRTTVRRI